MLHAIFPLPNVSLLYLLAVLVAAIREGYRAAVVTALLWIKGANKDAPYDYKLWFSDTYARTPHGWRYVFGQASIRLPEGS